MYPQESNQSSKTTQKQRCWNRKPPSLLPSWLQTLHSPTHSPIPCRLKRFKSESFIESHSVSLYLLRCIVSNGIKIVGNTMPYIMQYFIDWNDVYHCRFFQKIAIIHLQSVSFALDADVQNKHICTYWHHIMHHPLALFDWINIIHVSYCTSIFY